MFNRKYLVKRLLTMVLILVVTISVTFILLSFLPGSPYNNEAKLTDVQIQLMNENYGLDGPLIMRLGRYLAGLLHGDFGISFQFGEEEVSKIIQARIWPSFILGVQAMVLGTSLGIVIGVLSAKFHNKWLDRFFSIINITLFSIPNILVAIFLQTLFGLYLAWLPIAFWEDGFLSTILPTIALAIAPGVISAQFIRNEMITVLKSDYIELARAKGISEWRVIFVHGLRNALIPMMTIVGPMFASLLGGSLIIEKIYAIPGLGEELTKAILSNDYATVMGLTIVFSVIYIVVIFITDILYGLVDPRIRVKGVA
ncbi:ABC transporter permease [Vagococcus silagei]|nr:ABC transporter permease [Vagococcus silagei]